MKFTIQFTFNNKFLQHMAYDIGAYGELAPYNQGSLYDQYYSSDDPANHKFIFTASTINSEIISFIQEVEHKRNIFLYFDKFNKTLHDDATKNNIQSIVHLKDTKNIKNLRTTIKVDTMYSEHLLNIFDKETKYPDIDTILSMHGIESIPEQINNLLYPNDSLNIKMFDGSQISHIQNVGWIDDKSFMSLINNCKTLICPNNTFLPYGILLNKPTIALENNNWIKKTDNLTREMIIDNTKIPQPSISVRDIRPNSYNKFIEKNLI